MKLRYHNIYAMRGHSRARNRKRLYMKEELDLTFTAGKNANSQLQGSQFDLQLK